VAFKSACRILLLSVQAIDASYSGSEFSFQITKLHQNGLSSLIKILVTAFPNQQMDIICDQFRICFRKIIEMYNSLGQFNMKVY
jgi:hypothetical protein